MGLFIPASLNGYHVNSSNIVGLQFEGFIDGVLAAIGTAVDNWAKMATLGNVQVNAVTAAGGKLQGPKFEGLIMAGKPPMDTPNLQKYSKAVAKAVGTAFDKWTEGVKVPGLPWYPAFAAFPGPQAPPMPNIPVPLILLPSTNEAEMTPKKLEDAMVKALNDSDANHHKVLFKALGVGIGTLFQGWKAMTMVTMVMGKGPIPTFAPPFVPVGPVVGGTAQHLAPGGIVSPPSGAAALKGDGGKKDIDKLKQQAKEMEQKGKNADQEAKKAMKKLQSDFESAQKGPQGPGEGGGSRGR